MKFLCPFDESDAVCPACEQGDHEECQETFDAYGKTWECTCPHAEVSEP